MLGQINYELECSSKQSNVLQETLRRYNRACEYVLEVALKKRLRGHVNIGMTLVPDPIIQGSKTKLRNRVQDEFGIQSGLADNVMRHVSWELRRAEIADREPDFSGNEFIMYSQQTASLVMKAQHPAISNKPPIRISLTMAETRFQFSFVRSWVTDNDLGVFGELFKKNDLVLWVGTLPDEHVFMAFTDIPDGEE